MESGGAAPEKSNQPKEENGSDRGAGQKLEKKARRAD